MPFPPGMANPKFQVSVAVCRATQHRSPGARVPGDTKLSDAEARADARAHPGTKPGDRSEFRETNLLLALFSQELHRGGLQEVVKLEMI